MVCKNNNLHNTCIIKAQYFKKMLYMTISLDNFDNVINYFINNNEITDNNINYFVLALMIILEAVIYDNLIMMKDIIRRLPEISRQTLRDVMKHIISYYNKELFLYNTFIFYDRADNICKRIDAVTNKIVEIRNNCNDTKSQCKKINMTTIEITAIVK